MSDEYIYVTVDETGNLGRSLKNERFYVIAACVVSNRHQFEEATRRLNLPEELKFYTHPKYRESILTYAAPYVREVFFAKYHKEKKLNEYQQKELHLRMIRSVADSIVLRYGLSDDLVVEVDNRQDVPRHIVEETFENNEYRLKHIKCEVMDSCDSYGLQTNDFFVGAIGWMLNRSDFRYVKLFERQPLQTYIRSENRRRMETGETCFHQWQNTGHTDNPIKDSPPGIATGSKCLTPDQCKTGSPMVRLVKKSFLSYLKHGKKEKSNKKISAKSTFKEKRK